MHLVQLLQQWAIKVRPSSNLLTACFVLLLLSSFVHALPENIEKTKPNYVGTENCTGCHQKQAADWQLSDHFKAMAEANVDTVLGDFNNKQVSFHGISHTFFKKDESYYVRTLNKQNQTQDFKIDYVFGHYPLQQYLIDVGDGHFQAFNVAWDSRTKDEGGQRWYHLQPDEKIDANHPFHWTGSFLNWNSRCAECHSTNLEKNYSVGDLSYKTSWSDINVACEACHGPGSEHIGVVNSKQKKEVTDFGLAYAMQNSIKWQFSVDDPIAKPIGEASDKHISMCGGCHSRRQVIGDRNTPNDYHETYRLQTLENGLYFADGQILDEVYVLGSFMQSKMHQAGVTCMDCHNPHSGKLIAEPNQVCAQCHQSSVFESPKHTLHSKAGDLQCVDCHMPERVYMGVDARRDHSFSIPRAAASRELGLPLACDQCHNDKEPSWAVDVFKSHGIKEQVPEWVLARHKVANLDASALRPLYREISDADLPPLIRASLLNHLANFPSQESLTVVAKNLKDDDALVRASAVSSLVFADQQTRWSILSPLLDEKSHLVRFEMAPLLAPSLAQLNDRPEQLKLQQIIDEYREALKQTEDMPGSQLALAELELRIGRVKAAEQAYKAAISIVPSFVPALLNYSDFLRNQGRAAEEADLLKLAIKRVPDSASAQHAMGLHLIRAKDYQGALPYLKSAALSEGLDANPRFAYIYAVALDTLGQTSTAVQVLEAADKRWPRQVESLVALVMYLEKTQQLKKIPRYLRVLNTIAPESPQIRYWVQRYGLF